MTDVADLHRVLMGARLLIAQPNNWCRMHFAENYEEAPVSYMAADAVRFSLLGAISRASEDAGYSQFSIREKLYSFLSVQTGPLKTNILGYYNYSHTHAEVLSFLDLALQKLSEVATLPGQPG